MYHSGYHLLPDVVRQLQKRGQVITLDGYIAKEGEGWVNKAALAPEYLGTFYDANPNWYTSVRRISRAAPWGGDPGTNGVKIWRMRRDIIGQVIRGISLRKTVSPADQRDPMRLCRSERRFHQDFAALGFTRGAFSRVVA
ncbi:hypothetical protein KHC28_13530 [Ancylobacter sonchi]|uniref:hypothetical protein n=1 Tax=Ancylobacter sonchi TaxID=1937790 RepID=UPI001BD58A5F|nr:hypothetical protein [Ancylobacter sonchi]MBS7534681.1 hypothetical protein [Ancylobacter sonchi]